MGQDLCLGLVPDGTSIEQQQIRLSRVVSGQEPVPGSERIQHPAGVVLVHLAAKRLDVDQTPHNPDRLPPPKGRAPLLNKAHAFELYQNSVGHHVRGNALGIDAQFRILRNFIRI